MNYCCEYCPSCGADLRQKPVLNFDEKAVLDKSIFKKDDLVEVTHTSYSGPGKILGHAWLENILRLGTEKHSHFLVWWVDPQVTDSKETPWPGLVDIIDPQYGLVETGRSIKKIEQA